MLLGFLTSCMKKHFQNFVNAFGRGFLERRGQNQAEEGVTRHMMTYSQTAWVLERCEYVSESQLAAPNATKEHEDTGSQS